MAERPIDKKQEVRTLQWAFAERTEGKSFTQVADALAEIAGERGVFPFGASALKKKYAQWTQAGQPHIEEFVGGTAKPRGRIDTEAKQPISQRIHIDEAFLEPILKRIVQKMVKLDHLKHEGHDEQRPPDPVTRTGERGRKQDRVYKRFTVALDIVLAALFEREMQEKRLSAGRLLDLILFNRYGKPDLSYMKPPKKEPREALRRTLL